MADIRKHNRSLTREQALAQSVLSGNTGTVYYTTDSHTIIMNGVEYSKSDLKNLEGYFTDDNAKFNYRSTAGSQSVAGQANGDLATIEALYGDSLVWNQLIDMTNISKVRPALLTKSLNNGWYRLTNTTSESVTIQRFRIRFHHSMIKNHKYYILGQARFSGVTKNDSYDDVMHAYAAQDGTDIASDGVTIDFTKVNTLSTILLANDDYSEYYAIDLIRKYVSEMSLTIAPNGYGEFRMQAIDLSLMFGLGKEPTLAEFETFLANYFPRKDYAYNEGEVLNIKSNGIKTVGFNLWDEEWELGGITYAGGDNYSITDRIRSKNYVRVLGNTTYNFVTTKIARYIWFYNANKELITGVNGSNNYITLPLNASTFTTPKDACYLRFVLYNTTSYNHDVTINLAWSGNRNGEYEEHWEETTPIPITTLEGTKSDGTREVMFPDGLCGIGDYKDEIKGNKAIKRIGRVDLGSLSWEIRSETFVSTGTFDITSEVNEFNKRCLCAKYVASKTTSWAQLSEKEFGMNTGNIRIKDSSFTDVASFKASLQGIYAYYVLAEPIEYTLDQDFKVDYKVDDYGTEEILPENGTAPTSLPIIADIRYGINAVDTLARLHKDYVSVYPQSFNDEQKEQVRKNIGVDNAVNYIDFYTEELTEDSALLTMDVGNTEGNPQFIGAEIPAATQEHAGVMSASDKTALDNHTTAIANDEARLDALDKAYETEGEFGFRHSGGSDIYDVNAGVGRITRLVGNSVNWHQLAPELTSENYASSSPAYTSLTFNTEQGRKIVTLTALQSADEGSNKISFGGLFGAGVAKYPANHYYFWTMDVMPSVAMTLGVGVSSTSIESAHVSSTTGYTRIYGRSHGNTEVSCRFKVISAVDQGSTVKIKDIQVYDLTMMFGQGKEPTTAQMKTWLETYHRRYDYAREEKIIGFDPKEIVTQGSNLIFDNATVFPNMKSSTMDVLYKGDEITLKINTAGDNYLGVIRTVDIGNPLGETYEPQCIRVEPNTKYRINVDGVDADKVRILYYNFLDATYKLLDVGNGNSYTLVATPNLYFTTSAETYYVKIRLDFRKVGTNNYLDVGTYTFRVSLHKEGDGNKNGVVEKYWKKTKALTAPSSLKREDGSLIFPDGLMAIGDYHDEIVDGKAIKRIVKVDLGSLSWSYNSGAKRFGATLPILALGTYTDSLCMCAKYTTDPNCFVDADTADKVFTYYYHTTAKASHILIRDSAYTDVSAFKASLQGVYAYYVLNDPEVVEIGNVYDDVYQVDPYGTEMMCDDVDGNVDCYGSTKVKYGVDTAEDVGKLFIAHANACATANQNGLMSAADKQSLDLNNTPLRLMVLQDQRNSTYNLCVSENAAKFIDAGYKPVIYRRIKVKRHFAFNDAYTRTWKWIPFEEVVLTPLETSGQQSAYMKIGVPNLLRRKHIVVDTDTIYIGGSDIPVSDWLKALGVWNYGSPSDMEDNNHYYAAKDFVIESCPDYIIDYWGSNHDYSQTDSYVYAQHGAARKTLYAGGSVLKAFKMTLQYGFAFVEGSDITSKRVTDIIPFQLVHTPLENSSAVTPNNKGLRWKFRLR